MTEFPAHPLTWALIDDRPGNRTQALGVAEKLGWAYEEKHIAHTSWAALPNFLLGRSLLGIDRRRSSPLAPPWPELVIAAGRRLVPAMRCLKKNNPGTFLCYLMRPEVSFKHFDLVAVPAHDNPPGAPNVIATLGAPHRLTPETLAEAAAQWSPRFAHLPRPWITLLIGGDSPSSHYTGEDWHQLACHASALAERADGSLLVTTSRRTGARAADIVRLALSAPHFLHRWQPEGENPFLGMLGAADAVIVAGESMSMCSEACATDKPVFIFTTENSSGEKHKRLHEALYAGGHARPLDAAAALGWLPPAPLDEAGRIAQLIREQLNSRAFGATRTSG